MYGGEERCIQGFGRKAEGKRALGRIGLDRRMIINWIFKFFVLFIVMLFCKVNQQNAYSSN